MTDRQIIHTPNPRATRINYGGYHSGIMLELTRTGLEVWGYYDGCVGVEGGFIPFCQKVLTKHWPEVPKYGDITKLDGSELEPVDLICGGFPCQDVSLAGLRRGVGAGTRSGLYAEMLRLVDHLRPRFVLVENVSGLLTVMQHGEPAPISRVLGDLAEIGLDAEWDCLPAAAVGAPHIRDRVFILAHSRRLVRRVFQRNGEDGHGFMVEQGDDGPAEEWGTHRKLIALVPGVHPRTLADWWRTQSVVARSTDGVPDRLDRLRALGNAVVPQVAEWIGRRIVAATKENS